MKLSSFVEVPVILFYRILNKSYEEDFFCFSYSPFDKGKVLNASMKGVRLLSQVYSETGEKRLSIEAKKAVGFIIKKQNQNGSWDYSDKRKKIDNYHSGYILDCLDEYIKFTDDKDFTPNLEKGYKYYKENFFESNGLPKFFYDNSYPIDCTSGSQAILTLTRFNEVAMAKKVAAFLIDHMFDPKGYFYFRKFKNYTIKTSFMRWSNAWMFTALSFLLFKTDIR